MWIWSMDLILPRKPTMSSTFSSQCSKLSLSSNLMHMKTKVHLIIFFSRFDCLFLDLCKREEIIVFWYWNVKISSSCDIIFWRQLVQLTLFCMFRCHYWKDKRSWIPCGSQKRNHTNQRHSHDAVQAECWSGISQWPYWTHDRVNSPADPTTCNVSRWLLLL